MKRILFGLFAMIAVAAVVSSCTKTVNNTDTSMQAYSDNFTINSNGWIAEGLGYYHGLEMNDMIDVNTLKADAVVVYISLDGGRNYQALNTTLLDETHNRYVAYSYTHGVDAGNTYNVVLFAENVDGTQTALPPTLTVKIVVIPARLIANTDVNLKDYNAVKATFNLKD